jgi:hypothetical protein
MVLLLIAAAVLKRCGVSFGEALYLSLLAVTGLGYSMTEWRLRRGK